MPELQKSHIRVAVFLRAALAVVGKWLIGVLLGKVIKTALGLEDVFDQADPLYDVVLLNNWDFNTTIVFAAIVNIINVLVAACVASLGAAWAVKEGRRWRKQVLESVLGNTNNKNDGTIHYECDSELLTKIQVIEDFVAFDENDILFNTVRLALCMVLAFVFSWYAGVITVAMTILSEIASKIFERMRTHLHASIQENQTQVNHRLVDVLKNKIMVRIMGTAEREIQALQELEHKSDEQRRRDQYVRCFRDASKLLFTSLVHILFILVAWHIVRNTQNTSEAINAAVALFVTMLLLDELHKSLISLNFVHDRRVAFEDARATLTEFVNDNEEGVAVNPKQKVNESSPEDDKQTVDHSTTQDLDEPDLESATSPSGPLGAMNNQSTSPFMRTTDLDAQAISLRNVFLHYPGRHQPALRNFSNSFQRGQIHALVGESGSGKSSTLKIVANLLQAESGKIESWSGMKVAYVSQDQTLWHRTLRENVTYGADQSISDEKVWAALEWARLGDWVRQLPHQLDQVLDEKSISGGQLQRLHLAHLYACHQDTDCVLLDECLSALDETCREALISQLQVFLEGKTTLLVTHHTEMLRICQQIHDMADITSRQEGPVISVGRA